MSAQEEKAILPKWKYCDKVTYIWRGHWDDPALEYNGIVRNYWDIEDAIYNDFVGYAEDNNIEDNDKNFEKFCKENEDAILEYFEVGDEND